MTSRKKLTMNSILYMPEICKNLVSRSLLNKHGFQLLFEYNKVILSKSGIFVGKCYVANRIFKLNVTTIKPNNVNKTSTFVYLFESSNLWHDRLGHVNCSFLQRLINLNYVPKF